MRSEEKLTLAAGILVVELQASLAAFGDGIAASVEVTGTGLVACIDHSLGFIVLESHLSMGCVG